MATRPVILLVIAVAVAAVGVTAVALDGAPKRVSDDTAVTVPATTNRTGPVAAPSTTVAPPTTSVPVDSGAAVAEAVGSESYPSETGGDGADDAEQPGLVITNSGSATAIVGGNVVSGSPGDPPGAIVTGDATAVGNSSSVRTP